MKQIAIIKIAVDVTGKDRVTLREAIEPLNLDEEAWNRFIEIVDKTDGTVTYREKTAEKGYFYEVPDEVKIGDKE